MNEFFDYDNYTPELPQAAYVGLCNILTLLAITQLAILLIR